MKKDFTVTIGIPAYNEEANIGFLLRDILAQRCRRFVLQEIIVLSDGSTDKTVEIAHSVHSGRIHVFDDGERKGKSERVNEIFDRASESTDAIILLDADIVFSGELALDEMVQAFSMGADLVSPRLTTVPPKTFVGSCIVASHNMKQRLFAEWRNGDNIYSCHGAARLFRGGSSRNCVFLRVWARMLIHIFLPSSIDFNTVLFLMQLYQYVFRNHLWIMQNKADVFLFRSSVLSPSSHLSLLKLNTDTQGGSSSNMCFSRWVYSR